MSEAPRKVVKLRVIGSHQCCRDCHFLMRWGRPSPNAGEVKMLVSQDQRNRLASGDPIEAVIHAEFSVGCFHDVWDWVNNRADGEKKLEDLLKQDRDETCFFFPYTPGMYFQAAAELEKREADRREAKRDRALTKHSIYWALFGVFLTIIFTPIVTKWIEGKPPAPGQSATSTPSSQPLGAYQTSGRVTGR